MPEPLDPANAPGPNDSDVAAVDAGQQVPSSTETPASSTPAAAQPSVPSAAPSPVGAAPSTAAAAPAVSQPAATTFSARERLRSLGVDPTPFQDDEAVFNALIGRIQQFRELEPYVAAGRKYASQASQFEEWQRQQAAQQQAAQPQAKAGWKAPEYDPSWPHQTTFDPRTGKWMSNPGVDPMVGDKYTAFRRHQDDFTARLAREGPAVFMEEMQRVADERAQQLIQAHLAQYQTQTYVSSFEEQNQQWLYEHDQHGQVLRDLNGQPAFTEAGRRFYHHVNTANQLGIVDPRKKEEFAKRQLQADIVLARQQTAPAATAPAATNEQQKQALLAAGHRPSHAGTAVPASNPNIIQQPQNERLTLSEMMRARFKEKGITDEMVAAMEN